MEDEAESTNEEVPQSRFDSRYRRYDGDPFLLKLNRSALVVQPGFEDIDTYWVGYWLELARKALIRAEAAMVATASDLKTAYLNYTRAAIILDQFVPQHRDFPDILDMYVPIRDNVLDAIEKEADKIWTLLKYREMSTYEQRPPPFTKAVLQVDNKSIVFLLPIDISYLKVIAGIRQACARCCLPTDAITSDCTVRISGPAGLNAVITDDESLFEALDLFEDALPEPHPSSSQMAVSTGGSFSGVGVPGESDELPSYESSLAESSKSAPANPPSNAPVPSTPREKPNAPIEIPENFNVRSSGVELFKEKGIIDIELGLW